MAHNVDPAKTSNSKARLADLRKRAMQCRLSGMTYIQIGEALGISNRAAFHHVKHEIDAAIAQTAEAAEQVRQIELERLDSLMTGLWLRRQEEGVIDRILKIQDRRARYLGLDAPTKVAPTDPSGENQYVGMSDDELRRVAARVIGVDVVTQTPPTDAEAIP